MNSVLRQTLLSKLTVRRVDESHTHFFFLSSVIWDVTLCKGERRTAQLQTEGFYLVLFQHWMTWGEEEEADGGKLGSSWQEVCCIDTSCGFTVNLYSLKKETRWSGVSLCPSAQLWGRTATPSMSSASCSCFTLLFFIINHSVHQNLWFIWSFHPFSTDTSSLHWELHYISFIFCLSWAVFPSFFFLHTPSAYVFCFSQFLFQWEWATD